jgi:hypothetical protein
MVPNCAAAGAAPAARQTETARINGSIAGCVPKARESWSEPQCYTENCQRWLITRRLVIPDYGMGRAPPDLAAVAPRLPRRIVAFAAVPEAQTPACRR